MIGTELENEVKMRVRTVEDDHNRENGKEKDEGPKKDEWSLSEGRSAADVCEPKKEPKKEPKQYKELRDAMSVLAPQWSKDSNAR